MRENRKGFIKRKSFFQVINGVKSSFVSIFLSLLGILHLYQNC